MITVEHLTKYYGEHLAVDDLSFEIEEGHVYGFLGPNGAGKSTTMNIMTGCLSATDGHVLIDGHDIFDEPKAAKRLIGYLPEQPPLYMNESPVDYLSFVGEAKGLRGEELKRQVEEVITQTGLEKKKNRRISALSKGYKQRVGIAQALLGNPKVIILDEPTVGLDPIQIIEIRDLIKSLGETHTVIFSSHILSEVQTICDQILMIAGGKLVAFDTPENLERSMVSSSEIVISTDASEEAVRAALSACEGAEDVTFETAANGNLRARIKTGKDQLDTLSKAVFAAFVGSGLSLMELSTKKATLEDIFLELADDSAAAAEQESGASAEEAPAESAGAETEESEAKEE